MHRSIHVAVTLVAASIVFGSAAANALAQAPLPSKPIVSVVAAETPSDPSGTGRSRPLQVIIEWNYPATTFPDVVCGIQIFRDGTPVFVGPVPLNHSIFGSYGPNFEQVGNRFQFRLTSVGATPNVFRVQVTCQSIVGITSSELSDPFSILPPQTPPPPPGGGTPPSNPGVPPGVDPSTLFTPVLSRPNVSGNVVTLNWTYPGYEFALARFEIIAFVQATGQTLVVPVNRSARSFTQGGIPSGNFIVRMRAVHFDGRVSDLSAQYVVPVGVTLGTGAFSATLTWSSTADIDLNVIEPNGSRVYYANKNGPTTRLDVDDTNGFGPENIFLHSAPLAGVYRVYIVHFGQSVPTTSTIQIVVNRGQPNEQTRVITRISSTASPSTAIEVARVDVIAGTITEVAAIGSATQDGDPPDPGKVPPPQ
jgi:hypothetical protein